MSEVDPREQAKHLRAYAEHFVQHDWDYTRDLGRLREVRYEDPRDSLRGRLTDAARWLFKPQPDFAKGWGPNRFQMAAHVMRRDKHLPDGHLDGGGILTFWEETGEYLQFVQPSVGSLIANWMDAEPDNPHARLVAAEMQRISDRYKKRLEKA